jgi:hypothetical protein
MVLSMWCSMSHLHPIIQVHSVRGRLETRSIQAPQHLRNDGVDMDIIQPAGGPRTNHVKAQWHCMAARCLAVLMMRQDNRTRLVLGLA